MSEEKRDSRSQPSLDEIVTLSAADVAHQIQKAAAWAKSEMDLQVEAAAALKGFAGEAKITLEGHHNVTVATGRPDSVYGSVIVEYKDPGTLSPNKDAAPNKAVIEQLKRRFYDMNREEHSNKSAAGCRWLNRSTVPRGLATWPAAKQGQVELRRPTRTPRVGVRWQ